MRGMIVLGAVLPVAWGRGAASRETSGVRRIVDGPRGGGASRGPGNCLSRISLLWLRAIRVQRSHRHLIPVVRIQRYATSVVLAAPGLEVMPPMG
jgi:hypothetical protein